MKFPYGQILPHAPHGFVPPEMWPEYDALADPVAICKREAVGISPKGNRWALGPLCFEQYFGDTNPILEDAKEGRLARNRLIMWQRLDRQDIPAGWHQFSKLPWRVDGVYEFVAGKEYTVDWEKSARRDLRIWKEKYSSTYSIEDISLGEYKEAYAQSLIGKRLGLDRYHQLERRMKPVSEHIKLIGMRNPAGKIIAGTAIIFSPTYRSATHMAPFINSEGAKVYAATALNDYWFAETKRREFQFLMSTNFWFKNQPKSWRGFSEFKSHFGFQYVALQPTLWKFARGKLF